MGKQTNIMPEGSTSARSGYQLLVIGTGMAGMAAAFFAAQRGISVVQVGRTGGIVFASGLLDLMLVHPIEERILWENPWTAIDAVVHDIPRHPYSKLSRQDVRDAIEEFLTFLCSAGLPYRFSENRNSSVMTPLGTVKNTYGVPETMWGGVETLRSKPPCLLVDFYGLKDFSARQITSVLAGHWQGLRSARIPFPDPAYRHEVSTGEITARSLAISENMERLAASIKPHLGDARAVGLPAICGMESPQRIVAELSVLIGVPVFEIPTLPVSVPGLRLMQTFERELPRKGGRHLFDSNVLKVSCKTKGDFLADIGNDSPQQSIGAKGIILATGRFLSRGLYADRNRIRETLFDLPVHQPETRASWHRHEFFDPRGHLANRAGLEVDDAFRPLDHSGQPAHKYLFAAGSILAHQDWMRMKCGSGLAIATAYGAVKAFVELNG